MKYHAFISYSHQDKLPVRGYGYRTMDGKPIEVNLFNTGKAYEY